MDINILRDIQYGLYVITTLDGKRPTGCIANSLMQVTVEPVTFALSMSHDNFTNQCIRKSKKFAVSVITEKSDTSIITKFGFQSGKTVNKFDGLNYFVKDTMPVIPDSSGYMVFDLKSQVETSTHTIFIGDLTDADRFNNNPPMTYAYYHSVIKGSSPKNAPTYMKPDTEVDEEIEDDSTSEFKEYKYVCQVCGYIYDGTIPFDDLPDDYICPICKVPKTKFKKVIK